MLLTLSTISGLKLPDGWINHDYDNKFPETEANLEFNHRIVIYANSNTRTVVGFVELFGSLRFSAVLTDEWRGPDIAYAYVVDPVSHEQKEEQLELPHNLTIKPLLMRVYNLDKSREALQQLLKRIFEKQHKDVMSNIVDRAVEKHMTGKGDYITEEMISRIAHEVATEFVYYDQRISHVEDAESPPRK